MQASFASGDSGANPVEDGEMQHDDDGGELLVSLPGRLLSLGAFALSASFF
jgi:hypothetical protein